jgi:hypothetical protein
MSKLHFEVLFFKLASQKLKAQQKQREFFFPCNARNSHFFCKLVFSQKDAPNRVWITIDNSQLFIASLAILHITPQNARAVSKPTIKNDVQRQERVGKKKEA